MQVSTIVFFLLSVACVISVVAAQSCQFPTVPPSFQTNFSHRVASSSGNGQIVGHIYSDELNNRTRIDYTVPGTNVNYTVFEFINVQAKTETEYIVTRANGVNPQCIKHTFPYVVEQDNCTAWDYLGLKNINGQRVLAFLANCTFGTQSYAIEWFWLGQYPCSNSATYTPYEVIIQGPGYYSETDYSSFQVGGGSNSSFYTVPTQCPSSKPSAALSTPTHLAVRSFQSYLFSHF